MNKTINFTLRDGHFYVSSIYLLEKGVSETLLATKSKEFADSKSSLCAYYQTRECKWFLYRALPFNWISKFKLPISEDQICALHELQEEDNKELQKRHIQFIFSHIWNNSTCWKKFVPVYRCYYFDPDILTLFAKTHAIYNEIKELKKRYDLGIIHACYNNQEKILFRTDSYKYFSAKIRKAEKDGIENALLHAYKINERSPYKVDGLLKSRIKYYYALPKKYSYKEILQFVNNERLDRGQQTISYSTIKRILSDPEIRNKCDHIRYGQKYAEENIYPYLVRRDPDFAELLQIDSTRLNIPSKDVTNKKRKTKVEYLHLCVVMEVYSRLILGYCIATSERADMILESLKMALQRLEYIPAQILHDNHKLYYSSEFKKFSSAGFDCGIDFRASRVGNARDKSHVERWFGTFQTEYTNYVYGSMGEGIKTSRKGGRVQIELEKEYTHKNNLRERWEVKKLIEMLIERYNDKIRRNNKSPNQIFKEADRSNLRSLTKPDFERLFFKRKNNKEVQQSKIHLEHEGQEYSYTINNNILADRLNGTKVNVRFDPEDTSVISIYDKESDKYICDLKSDYKINPVPKKKDWKVITENQKLINDRVLGNMAELKGEFINSREVLESSPIIALNPKSNTYESANIAEGDQLMQKEFSRHIGKNSAGKTHTKPGKEVSNPDRSPSINIKRGSMRKLTPKNKSHE